MTTEIWRNVNSKRYQTTFSPTYIFKKEEVVTAM